MNVLLVEDDERIVEFVGNGLHAENCRVRAAGTVAEARELVSAGRYDVIILDRRLPDADGLSLCRELRAARVSTPILMLTVLDTVEEKVKGFRLGADDYLTKPFAFEELLVRVHALARRNGAFEEARRVLCAGDLTMNLEAHEVRRGADVIELTPKEFDLLRCLMERPGKALSRALILEKAWGHTEHPLTNVVDVYVRQLRRKVDRDATSPIIETVRGVGYRLRPG